MTRRLHKFILVLIPAILLAGLVAARAQAGAVRLNVNKVQKKDRKTMYQSTDGRYRHQQINETVHYRIEVVNSSSGALAGLRVKWALLVDRSMAEARGGGIFTTRAGDMEVIEGERSCNLGLGQKYVFDTDPVDLSSVRTESDYDGRRHRYGGQVRGYCVEVLAGNRLLAADIQPPDTREKIQLLKAGKEKGK